MKLKNAILIKYGVEKYALGVEIIARWVAFETKRCCSMETVLSWCSWGTDKPPHNTPTLKQYEALCKILGKENL